jgi:3-phenylpropionate/trans-cinnamate dioxygenase ferredoxin subunit
MRRVVASKRDLDVVPTLAAPPSSVQSLLRKSDLPPLPEIIDICPVDELPPGAMRVVLFDDLEIAVVNCAGTLYAIEDRCSHDDGPLAEGLLHQADCAIECPRHGSLFDLRTGAPKTLPAYEPVDTFEVRVEGDLIKLEVE